MRKISHSAKIFAPTSLVKRTALSESPMAAHPGVERKKARDEFALRSEHFVTGFRFVVVG